VDSRDVNKALRESIRPVLKEKGFSLFTLRVGWRLSVRKIDVLSFQSFNSYNAEVLGCTTHSFSVRLGCYLLGLPASDIWRQRFGEKGHLPKEADCHFRGHLERSFPQPEFKQRGVWYIDPHGKYLDRAVHDVRIAFLRDALPWFARLDSQEEVLRILREEDMADNLWGFGAKGSPARSFLLENLADGSAA
jgi:hypothetical protein